MTQNLLDLVLDCRIEFLEFKLFLTELEGHKIGGMIGYWLSEISFNLQLTELDARFELSKNLTKPIDWSYAKKSSKTNIFGLKQIKFMLSMGKRINKVKENPNEVLKEHLIS